MEDNYTLTWDTYGDHFKELMLEQMMTAQFADVTLVCADQEQIKAHRFVLQSCSSVFRM